MRWWVKPWMVWVIAYPLALADRMWQAAQWAAVDVQQFISEREKAARKDQSN